MARKTDFVASLREFLKGESLIPFHAISAVLLYLFGLSAWFANDNIGNASLVLNDKTSLLTSPEAIVDVAHALVVSAEELAQSIPTRGNSETIKTLIRTGLDGLQIIMERRLQ